MRKLRDTLLLIIILAGAVIGGTKYLLWYYTDQLAKNIQQFSPPGYFTYNGISTSFTGKTSIDNIVLSTNGTIIYIKKMELETDNIFELLLLIAKNWNKKLPKELAVNFEEIKIDGYAFFKNSIDDEIAIEESPTCQPTTDDYIAMGYKDVIINTKLQYKRKPGSKLTLNYLVDIKDIITISGNFSGNFSVRSHEDLSGSAVSDLPEFNIVLSNNQLLKNTNLFCAKKQKLSLDAYLKTLTVEKTKETIDTITAAAFGFVFDDNVIIALNQYEKNPELFDLSIKPTVAVPPAHFKKWTEANAINVLQPTLSINGNYIPISFKWFTLEELIESKKPAPEYKDPIIQSAERIRTPINELNKKAFNKKIEVRLTSGRVYKGPFTKVEGNLLHMMILNNAGTSTLSLKTDSIHSVYILSDF